MKTRRESEPNLSFVKKPNLNQNLIDFVKYAETESAPIDDFAKTDFESESDFAFCKFLRIYDSVTES